MTMQVTKIKVTKNGRPLDVVVERDDPFSNVDQPRAYFDLRDGEGTHEINYFGGQWHSGGRPLAEKCELFSRSGLAAAVRAF